MRLKLINTVSIMLKYDAYHNFILIILFNNFVKTFD